jgi:hypothetical protein
LVTAYYDARLEPNSNLAREFPLIPWRGEVAVLFLGERRHFLVCGPPEAVVHHALAVWVYLLHEIHTHLTHFTDIWGYVWPTPSVALHFPLT